MHLVILVWPTRVRMEARHKAATAIELPKEGRTVPSGPNEDSGPIGSLSFTPHLAERSSPSRVRYAAQNQRALDCSGPFHRIEPV